MAISLEKVAQHAPELVEQYKKTTICLDKVNLRGHVARVVCVLDISGSMQNLYNSGKVGELVKKALALGLQFDDDGAIDVFAFGENAHYVGEFGMSNYKDCVSQTLNRFGYEGGTRYAEPLRLIEQKYGDSKLPVYVMFITDGETSEKEKVIRQMISLSKTPCFIQCMGLGEDIFPADGAKPEKKKGFFSSMFSGETRFEFLRSLDNLAGRAVDNANFFAVKDPAQIDDEKLYSLLMGEYPTWLPEAKRLGLL
jgi:hypothetical protein